LPILPIGDGAGGTDDLDPLVVLAAITFPRDVAKQRQFIGRFLESSFGGVEESARAGLIPDFANVPHALIGAMIGAGLGRRLAPLGGFSGTAAAPGFEQLSEEILANAWAGSIAGDMISWITELHVHGYRASVRKAVSLALVYYQDVTGKDGKNRGSGERYIQDSWKLFKPSAHLWAALRLWMFAGEKPPAGPAWLSPFSIESLPTFLTFAQSYLRVVTAIVPHGRKEPILDRQECWEVPQGYPLNADVHIRLGPLPDWILARAGKPMKKK
jgi:hypothetical protein